jgi:hypothetical protein
VAEWSSARAHDRPQLDEHSCVVTCAWGEVVLVGRSRQPILITESPVQSPLPKKPTMRTQLCAYSDAQGFPTEQTSVSEHECMPVYQRRGPSHQLWKQKREVYFSPLQGASTSCLIATSHLLSSCEFSLVSSTRKITDTKLRRL